jgi:hypothetical protein
MKLRIMVDRYLRHTGTPPTRFGRQAAGDPHFVKDLRNGREVGSRLACRVQAFILEQML